MVGDDEQAPGSPEEPDPAVVQALRPQHAQLLHTQGMGTGRFLAFLTVFIALMVQFFVVVFAIKEITGPAATVERTVVIGIAALILGLLTWGISDWALTRARQNTARLLLATGHFDPAMRLLKGLARKQTPLAIRDEATYMIALAYDQQGKVRLAQEGYKAYLKDFEEHNGSWIMEARVRLEELASDAPPLSIAVQAQTSTAAKPDLRCPFCRDTLAEEALTAECADCATPHHLKCYEEQGGCAVYGCRSSTVKTRISE